MAYGKKYTITFCDIREANFTIDFYFKDYVGDVADLQCGKNPVEVEWDSKDNIFEPIVTSKAKFFIFSTDTYNQDDFIVNDESGAYVEVRSIDTGFYWWGWLLPENSRAPLKAPPYLFEVNAADLFTIIKGKELVGQDGFAMTGTFPLTQYLVNSVITGMRTLADIPFNLINNLYYYPAIIEDGNALKDTMIQTRLESQVFFDQNYRWDKCDKVMSDILKVFSARMIMSNGEFYVIRVPYAATDGAVVKKRISLSPLSLSSISYDLRKDVNCDTSEDSYIIKTDAILTSQRAIKEQGAHFKYRSFTSIIKNPIFSGFNTGTGNFTDWAEVGSLVVDRIGTGRPGDPYRAKINGFRNNTNPLTETKYFEGTSSRPVQHGKVLDINIKARAPLNPVIQPDDPILYFTQAILKLTDGVTTYYLNSAVSNGQIGAYEWNASPRVAFELDFKDNSIIRKNVQTPQTPIGGDLTIQFFRLGHATASSGIVTNQWWELYSVGISEVYEDDFNKVIGEYHYFNQSGNFSYIPELTEVILGDTTNDIIAGTLLKDLSFGEVPTYNWYRADEGLTFVATGIIGWLVRSIAQERNSPTTVFEGVINSNSIFPHNTLKFKNGSETLINGVFLITKDKYEIKPANHNVIAYELIEETDDFVGLYDKFFEYKE